MPLKVLICGGRNLRPVRLLRRIIALLPPDTVVIHGGCRGVDRLAGQIAKERGLKVLEFPADWARFGRAAGPIRNRQMLSELPDVVVAVHDHPGLGTGTADMVRQARGAGVPTFVLLC